jgi:flagellar FliJ protein
VHENFVGKLGQAINQQDALTRSLDDRHRQQLAALAEGERRLKALETLVQRREAAQRRRQESREQKQTDEFAAQAYARATSGSDGHD